MQQLKKIHISLWDIYVKYVQKVVLNNEPYAPEKVSFWRNAAFCKILTYLTPLSLIALIPSVIMAFMNGFYVVGIADLVGFFTIVLITVGPGLKLEIRKATFILVLYCLSVILLYYLPLPAPGLLFLLTVTIFSSIVYSSAAAYFSAWINTAICVLFGVLIYFATALLITFSYDIGAWVATSSNLVLLSFACAKCLDLLLNGLTNSLRENRISEEKLEKANRLYQFISQINQTIVHVKDAKSLFRDSCRIALDLGKYKMAWIGGFDIPQKKISLLEYRGIPSEDIQLFTDASYANNGPQDYVLRTDSYFLCNNIENAPGMESWKAYAKKHDIRSFIVLPIRKSGNIFGTFNLYASELNFFHSDDIALLKEVTGDISFALDLFEKAERHKEAEELLLKNEKLFRVLTEKGIDMKTMATVDGKITYASPSITKLLGYTVEEFLETSTFNMIHPDDIPVLSEKIQNLLKSPGGSFFNQHRILHKNGNWIWSEGSLTNMLHEPGIESLVSNFRDITEKKKAEIELQKHFDELEAVSKQRSAILNTLPASIALLDNEGVIVKVNEEWKKFGKTEGLHDFYPHLSENYIELSEKSFGREANYGKQLSQGLQEVLRGNREYFAMEYPCNLPTEKKWFKVEARPFKSNLRTGVVVMHIDITERKNAEAEMLLLINNTEEAFVLLNRNLQIVSFNNQFNILYKKYFGLEIQKGDLILDYAQPNRKEITASIYEKVLEGNVEESEIIIPYLNTTKYFSLKYTPAKDESGNIFGAFVTAIDITEKKKAEEQKEFERRDKEALINSTEDLIWSISNDYKLIAANNSFIREIKKHTGVELKQGDDILNFVDFPPEYLNYWKGLYNRALSGESFKTEIYTPQEAGRDESWLDNSFSPIISNEQIIGIACYARNITEKKRAENKLILTSTALQGALNGLNKIMDSSLDIICTIDGEGNFVNVSAASEDILGYTPHELEGTRFMDYVFVEDVEKTSGVAEEIMSGVSFTMFENRYVHKNGGIVPIIWSAKWDYGDKLMYCIAKDGTEKKSLEKAVESERQRFFDLFSEAPSSMGILSGPDHVFEIVNPLYLQLIGKKDIIGKTVREVLPEAVDQGIINILDEVYKTGKTFSSNEMLIKLDVQGTGQLVDKYLNFMYQAHRTEGNTIDGILFFAVDVTEQVVLRKRIEESEAKLKEAQTIAHISNWEIDLLTNSHTWSDEFYSICGIKKGEALPSFETFLSFIYPEDVIVAKEKMQEAFKTLEASSINFRILPQNGSIKYVYAEWKFDYDKSTPTRLYGILQDITERKIAEEEREKLIHDLIQRNRDLEQFTFIISHNLRAPTANIIGFSEVLQGKDLTPQVQKELLNGLSSSVAGLDAIIKDINSILQVKREVNENKEKIVFSRLVKEITGSIEKIIHQYNVNINVDFSEVDELFSLKIYMHSIFYNLISNSIKYRKPDEKLVIEIRSRRENGKIILSFKDNGLGIDMKANSDKVFGLYKRFHSHVEGKGMGLFMVKTQVEAIGGKITVESELNKGTEFTIVIQ
ncbi:MAG: PAS domain S-box protein [Cytophagaceae bacterium]